MRPHFRHTICSWCSWCIRLRIEVFEVFEETGHSFVHGTLDYLQGLKMLRVKRVERVLPTSTTLTIVGEAVKDNKTIQI